METCFCETSGCGGALIILDEAEIKSVHERFYFLQSALYQELFGCAEEKAAAATEFAELDITVLRTWRECAFEIARVRLGISHTHFGN